MERYTVLKRGNFYFPFLYTKDRFIVEDIIDIPIKGKDAEAVDFALKRKRFLYLGMIADAIWGSMKKELGRGLKAYNDCWFVPTSISKFDKEYVCSVDVLRRAK